jgi:cobalt/nickel transport system permease protein
MHIPDGYLSPQTCAFFYVIMLPLWYLAFRKLRGLLGEKEVSLLGALSAFSFIVMMFNFPVPDGTTAHMVGGALITALMGPYAALISVSIALGVQALLFGDGGVTTFAANAFNMGVVLPFVTYAFIKIFQTLLKNEWRGRLYGSVVGGYIGIVAAAIMCGLELGIQPLLFKGYSPYPYWMSVPGMALAHMVIAGPIEAVVTFAVLNYIRKYSPSLLSILPNTSAYRGGQGGPQ